MSAHILMWQQWYLSGCGNEPLQKYKMPQSARTTLYRNLSNQSYGRYLLQSATWVILLYQFCPNKIFELSCGQANRLVYVYIQGTMMTLMTCSCVLQTWNPKWLVWWTCWGHGTAQTPIHHSLTPLDHITYGLLVLTFLVGLGQDLTLATCTYGLRRWNPKRLVRETGWGNSSAQITIHHYLAPSQDLHYIWPSVEHPCRFGARSNPNDDVLWTSEVKCKARVCWWVWVVPLALETCEVFVNLSYP